MCNIIIVVCTPIHLCTKDIRDVRLMDLFNCCITPKIINPSLSEPLFIFWSKLSSSSMNELDHFVPLFDASSFNVSTHQKVTVPETSFDYKVLTDIFVKIGMKRKNTILPMPKANTKKIKIPAAVTPLYRSVPAKLMNTSGNSTKPSKNLTKTGQDLRLFFPRVSVDKINPHPLMQVSFAPVQSVTTTTAATVITPNNLMLSQMPVQLVLL